MENEISTHLSFTSSETTSLASNFTNDYYYDYGTMISKDHQHPEPIHIFSMVIYAIAFLLGTTGNGLVIGITGFKMTKTVNTVWFLNLAIADFIFTFFLPLSIIYTALVFHWPFGRFMCKFNSTITMLNLFASVFLLTIISIDRCISVVLPVWSQNHRTPQRASITAIVVWCLALLASLPYAVFRDTKAHDGKIVCFNNFQLTDNTNSDLGILRHKILVATKLIISFIIPFTVIVSCYTVIALRIYRNHKSSSTKPFKIIIAVLISFFVCWFPHHVFSFLELSHQNRKDEALDRILFTGIPITTSLAFLNSCVNPFLYVFMGRDFKEKFRSSILSIFEKAFSEDVAHTEIRSKTKSTFDSLV
ncbi:chemerin-like receptor 1 [Discoglossus pictus]